MFTPHTRFRPNTEEVAAKVMDGEAILINLSNGVYYSMDNVGGVIWELVEGQHNLEEMIAAIRARYEVSAEQAQADVERLVGELLEENLALETDATAPCEESQSPKPDQRTPYVSPELNTYRDMGDLLALDPPMPGLADTPWKEPGDESSQ